MFLDDATIKHIEGLIDNRINSLTTTLEVYQDQDRTDDTKCVMRSILRARVELRSLKAELRLL